MGNRKKNISIIIHLYIKKKKTRLYFLSYRALNTVAYTFRTGPWRECWVKFGIDPRTDKKYYMYVLRIITLIAVLSWSIFITKLINVY